MTKTCYVKVRGISFNNSDGTSRQEIAKKMYVGQSVTLKANPMHKYGRWTVEVFIPNGSQIGFLPADARDASTILRGEPILAKVHKVIGGTNWFSKVILGKKSIGVVLALSKEEPDWHRFSRIRDKIQPFDDMVKAARAIEKSGDIEKAIGLYKIAIEKIEELTQKDNYASAHRYQPAPINRLSLLLEKKKDYFSALAVIQKHYEVYDPVQPDKVDRTSIKKRYERLIKKLDAIGVSES